MPYSPKICRRPLPESVPALHASPLLSRLYAARGLQSPEETDLALAHLLPPDALLGLDAAVELLLDAIAEDRRIVVVGDFDCDGATGAAVAMRGLSMLGARQVCFKVPHRVLHGYGLTPGLVEELVPLQPELLITVDSGIACLPGVARAKALGWRVLITDHHLPGERLPDANAIVNPNQPGCAFASKALAGVGVMFYLLLAVRRRLREHGLPGADADLSGLLDLVAVGTVADMVKLDANNRRLVRAGLARIRQGRCQPGIKALAAVSGLELAKLTEVDIGFRIGPKINAAGRLEDMALGIECLLAEEGARAMDMAESLHAINQERQELQQDMLQEAEQVLASVTDDATDAGPAVLLFQPHWHPGIIGLVASRVKDSRHRPALVFAPSEPGSAELRGSARSIPGFHIRDALAHIDALHPGLISRFGGHAMAAGLSLPMAHLSDFQAALQSVARAWIAPDALQGVFWSDGALAEHELERETALLLQGAGPWGQGFAPPLFDNEFGVLDWRVLKDRHLKLRLALPGSARSIDAIQFGGYVGQAPPARIRAVYELQTNDWRERRGVQCLIRHLEPA